MKHRIIHLTGISFLTYFLVFMLGSCSIQVPVQEKGSSRGKQQTVVSIAHDRNRLSSQSAKFHDTIEKSVVLQQEGSVSIESRQPITDTIVDSFHDMQSVNAGIPQIVEDSLVIDSSEYAEVFQAQLETEVDTTDLPY